MRRRASALLIAAAAGCWPAALEGAARIDHEAECTHKELGWDDFRGPVVNGQQAAWIWATIVIEPVEAVVVERPGGGWVAKPRSPVVYALMDKLRSGAQRGQRTERNLAHEQAHFDLTEYAARKLHRELGALEVSGETAGEKIHRELLIEVERLYAGAVAEMQELNARYDRETVHGTKRGAQKEWLQRAADLLASEAPYPLR